MATIKTKQETICGLTELERRMLRAIRDSEYHNGQDPIDNPVWTEYVCEGFGPSAGGVMASLVRKGLAGTDGVECCWINAEGFRKLARAEAAALATECKALGPGAMTRPAYEGKDGERHRFSLDSDGCACGGCWVYFEDARPATHGCEIGGPPPAGLVLDGQGFAEDLNDLL